MSSDASELAGNADLLILGLLERQDLYGYQMIEELARRSERAFELKAGTLYPLLHLLEQRDWLESYEGQSAAGKPRKYYHLTDAGRAALALRRAEWERYSAAVNRVLAGGAALAEL